jgi:hypothetical protein
MTLPQIQTEIFRHLVEMAQKLQKDYLCEISRNYVGNITLTIHKSKSNLFFVNWHNAFVNVRNTRTKAKITAEINRIWQAIPAECKKPNTWV